MKISEIPRQRRLELNKGLVETQNLTEWLAVEQSKLLQSVSAQLRSTELKQIQKKLPKGTVPKQVAWIGNQLSNFPQLAKLKAHSSDLVRGWACYAVATKAKNLKGALQAVKPFARDPHFGIRELAWMAVRERICETPNQAIDLLLPWAKDGNANIRRFASEATRPRGVWAKHIVSFKKDPSPGQPLLDLLFSDKSKYVRDSVGNWLNDSAKDNPVWVRTLVSTWGKKSSTEETRYIIKRGTRLLFKLKFEK